MSRKKGNETENELEKLYQRAGFKTERSVDQRWDRTDWFGIIDIMAVHPSHIRMIQAKTNTGGGVREVFETASRIFPGVVETDFAIRYTRKNEDGQRVQDAAWRLLRPTEDAEGNVTYETVVDERKMDCDLGEGLLQYLRTERARIEGVDDA